MNLKLEQYETQRVQKLKSLAQDVNFEEALAQLAPGSSTEAESAQPSGQELLVRKITQELKRTQTADFGLVFQLIWCFSHVKHITPDIETRVWILLEAMLTRAYNPTILVVPPQQVAILVSSFFKVGYGSDALWNDFSTYIKIHPKQLTVSIRCLVFHSLLVRGLLREVSNPQNLKIFKNQMQTFGSQLWNLADTLAADEKNVVAYDRLKVVMNLIMYAHLSNITLGFGTLELANRVRLLLDRSLARKLVGEEPILMIAVTKIIHKTLEEEFKILIKHEHTKSTEIAIRSEDLQGWTSFARVLYYLDRKLDNFTLLCPLAVYIYLGRMHLDVAPLAARLYLSDQEPLLDDLTIKRRVLHHNILERAKGLDPWTALMALELCLIEDYMDDKLLPHLVFKLSAALDNYSPDQVVTIALALKYFGLPTDHSFFRLFEVVLDTLVSEVPETLLDTQSPILAILQAEFGGLLLPLGFPTVDVKSKPESLLHSEQAFQLVSQTPAARENLMEYYWIFVAEAGTGSASLNLGRVAQSEAQELTAMLADSSPLQLAINTSH